MPKLNDPTVKDLLGFGPYVSGIENLINISSSDDLPFAVGVYGPWGSGKSSFMMMLMKNLELSKTPTVWFNAWK